MTEEPAAPAVCCEQSDPETQKPCALCEKPTCKNCRTIVDRRRVCPECVAQIEAELASEKAGAPGIPVAVAGGVVGSLLGGILWAAVAVITDFEVGYVAIGVGWLAGQGVVRATGGKKGQVLQVVAVLCSVLGLLLGKYFTVAHVIKTEFEGAEGLSYLDPAIIEFFFENLGEMVNAWDILWLILALGIAYRIPAPTKVAMGRRSS